MVAAAATAGFTLQAAFEYEFFLLRDTAEGVVPADESVFAATAAMDQNRAVIDAIAEACLGQGMPIEQYYPEAGPGQHEISIRHSDALTAADRHVAFRETARAVARQHGLRASFVPKIFEDKAGSGCHLHLSLWQDGRNVLADPAAETGLSPRGRAFIGGLLHHLPALMAVTTPSVNSYRRIRPHCWSGAFRCWGIDNREAAVRVPSNPAGGGVRNLELKTVDGSANPYLALGAVLAAGLDGMRRQLDPGQPVAVDPGLMSEAERVERRLDPLPTQLGDALEALRADPVLRTAFGPELSQAFLAVRQAEWEAMRGLTLAEEVKLLLERY